MPKNGYLNGIQTDEHYNVMNYIFVNMSARKT